jgi:hypothetical protein
MFLDVRLMLEPVATSAAMHGELAERSGIYTRRLDEQVARIPTSPDDQISAGAIETLTRLTSNGHDTMHRLVMDLHWEINRLQSSISVELLDGAHVYDVTEVDRRLVRAFMRGIHETAGLKFDHPGLETTATRDGDHLAMQNDLGVGDAHVVLVHVAGLRVRVTYSDVHRTRGNFLREMLEAHHPIAWTEAPDGQDFTTYTGAFEAADEQGLDLFLTTLGSRLVFLIDWNRARKRLSLFIRKADATALLKWAAENNVGHEAFLQAGDVRLINTALTRAKSAQVPYGARLDEILGRDGANRFLMSVLQIVSSGLTRHVSPRLIDDEIEAELLMYLQRPDRTLLGAVADHALVLAGMVERIRRAMVHIREHRAETDDGAQTVALMRSWKSDADTIIERARRTMHSVEHPGQLRRLLSEGNRAVKVFEEAAFTLTLVPANIDTGVAELLDELADLASRASRKYLSCLEDARGLSHHTGRQDLERFLVTIDRLVALQEGCDEAVRSVKERMLRGNGNGTDFRTIYVVSELTRQLERATGSLVHSGLLVRDYVLSVSPGG